MDIHLTTQKKQVSEDGTVKILFVLPDGNAVETVLMKHDYGNSVCVSSQAGCSMGCRFCASGLYKKRRNLTAEEMLAQAACAAQESKEPVTHLVVMGTGEPFDNYDEVLRFCDICSDEKKLQDLAGPENELQPVAPRHITVSTCGLVPGIRDFAKTKKRYNLAISLHAPNDTVRDYLMPVNKVYPTEALIKAAEEYCLLTKRRVTFEYILLDGINDSPQAAQELADLLKQKTLSNKTAETYFYVNLIPFNSVEESGFHGVSKETALQFYDIIMKNGIRATLRKERGADIKAACGQLRSEALLKQGEEEKG